MLLRFEEMARNKKYDEKGNVHNYTLKPSVRANGGSERKRKKPTFFAPTITHSHLTLCSAISYYGRYTFLFKYGYTRLKLRVRDELCVEAKRWSGE